MANTYEQFFKTVQPGMLDGNGRFKGPGAGVNYQAEGMTPQEFYAFMNQQVGDPMARDGADSGQKVRGDADAGWKQGVVGTGDMWSVPLAMLAAPFAASSFGLGGAGLGMTPAEADAALAAFDASQIAPATVAGGAAGAVSGSGGGLLSPTGTGMSVADADKALANFDATQSGSSLGSVGSFLKNSPGLTQLAGAGLGALANSKDTQNTNTQSTDPWAPAQPYLKDNLQTNANMQEYYRANPFSSEQKTAYQGLLNTLANNNANVPALLANAGNFGQSSRGKMPAMAGLLSGTQAAPIDWNAYANIGRK